MVILPYAGEKGCTLIKSLKKNLQRAFQVDIQTRIVYTGIKLSSQFRNVKDATHLKSSMKLSITPFVMLKTLMRITSVKVLDG